MLTAASARPIFPTLPETHFGRAVDIAMFSAVCVARASVCVDATALCRCYVGPRRLETMVAQSRKRVERMSCDAERST